MEEGAGVACSEEVVTVRGCIAGDAGVVGIEALCVVETDDFRRSAEPLEVVLEAPCCCVPPLTIMW